MGIRQESGRDIEELSEWLQSGGAAVDMIAVACGFHCYVVEEFVCADVVGDLNDVRARAGRAERVRVWVRAWVCHEVAAAETWQAREMRGGTTGRVKGLLRLSWSGGDKMPRDEQTGTAVERDTQPHARCWCER